MKVKRSLVTVVLIFLIILSGCTQAKEEKDDHLTVFLWESRLIKYLVPYIREQFPDKDIEFIVGNNDTDLYSYYNEHGELPDIITVRRYSGTDAIDLRDELLDLSAYDIVTKYYNYALQYYYNSDNSINWLPVCGIPQTIIANKTLFDRYDIKIPTNYEEYVKACDKFYKLGIKPYSMDLAEDWSNHEIIQGAAIGLFTSLEGIKWRNEVESTKGDILFDDEFWLKVYEQTSQFIKDTHFTADDLNVGVDEGWEMFINEESAMFHGSPEILKNSEKEMNGAELIRLPYFSQDNEEGYIYTSTSLHVALNKNLKDNKEKLETALAVVDCMISEKGQQLISDGGEVISFNLDVPSTMNVNKGLEEQLNKNNFYLRYAGQKSFKAAYDSIHGLLSGRMDEQEAYKALVDGINNNNNNTEPVISFENDYSIFLNKNNGRDGASSILTTVAKKMGSDLALSPYYYFTSSIYKGDCSAKRIKLMIAQDTNARLYLLKLTGKEIYELVDRYLSTNDGDITVTNKYELPIASGMKLVLDKDLKLTDILVDGETIDLDKEYSIMLLEGMMPTLKALYDKDYEPIENSGLSIEWNDYASLGQQPSAPEDYIEIRE